MSWNDLSGLVTVRPLSKPLPRPTYDGYFASPFSASFSSTAELFADETRKLGAKRIIIEGAFRENQLRVDGLPRTGVTPDTPGIAVFLLGTTYGDLRYEGTVFRSWEANLRAIALALEALRKVDRYGVTKRGEQYAGWKQLTAPAGEGNVERGRQIIAEHGSVAAALKKVHPDVGGDAADFRDVMAAKSA